MLLFMLSTCICCSFSVAVLFVAFIRVTLIRIDALRPARHVLSILFCVAVVVVVYFLAKYRVVVVVVVIRR